jgi:dihydroorotase
MGMLGLQTALAVAIETMIEPGLLDWHQLADRMSGAPARIGRVRTQGHPIAIGSVANVVVVDPTARTIVDPAAQASRSRNTPFAGRELPGRVVHTLFAGRPTVVEGRLA